MLCDIEIVVWPAPAPLIMASAISAFHGSSSSFDSLLLLNSMVSAKAARFSTFMLPDVCMNSDCCKPNAPLGAEASPGADGAAEPAAAVEPATAALPAAKEADI